MSELPLILVGLFFLVAGAELLVRASAFIATQLGLPSLLIGLTIVAFGTSAPEVVASVTAALRQSPDIAVGNVVGSNITNALLVAGAAAVIAPIKVAHAVLKRDGLLALIAAAAFWAVCWLQLLNAVTGAALMMALALYVVHSYKSEKRSVAGGVGAARSKGEARGDAGLRFPPLGRYQMPVAILSAVVGVTALAFGGNFLVDAALALAATTGVSEATIGLTIVAIGTSLPELATSMLAANRRSPLATSSAPTFSMCSGSVVWQQCSPKAQFLPA